MKMDNKNTSFTFTKEDSEKQEEEKLKCQQLIGKRLRRIRDENNMTMKEVANKIGFSESIISRYESGLTIPRKSTLVALSNLFGVNYDWIAGSENADKFIESSPKTSSDENEYNTNFKPLSENMILTRIKKVMDDKGVTLENLSTLTGVSLNKLKRYFNKIDSFYMNDLDSVAEALDVNIGWIVGDISPKNRSVARPRFKKIPVLGIIAAGQAIYAQEDIIGVEQVPETENVDFALLIRGDSMINARIFDGDTVFIRQQQDVENGEIAAVLIDDDATLKRIYKINGTIILHPENPQYKDMVFTEKTFKEIRILGKAVFFRSNVR